MMQTKFDQSLIKKILPHREPFLFVDSVISFRSGERITTHRFISDDDCFLKGHFPGKAIMPGVLVTEALAQTSGLLLGLSSQSDSNSSQPNAHNFYLASVDMKYVTPAKPGETLRLESRIKKKFGKLTLFAVMADVKGLTIAKGTLSLGWVDMTI